MRNYALALIDWTSRVLISACACKLTNFIAGIIQIVLCPPYPLLGPKQIDAILIFATNWQAITLAFVVCLCVSASSVMKLKIIKKAIRLIAAMRIFPLQSHIVASRCY